MSLTKLSLGGNYKISDNPAGDGKTITFLQCVYLDKVPPAQSLLNLPELEAFGLGAAAPDSLSGRLPVRPAPPATRRRLHRLSTIR
jgi:hypothetical protein